MHRRKPTICLALLFAIAILQVQPIGCAGQRARDGIGVPSVNRFVEAVIPDAVAGIQTLPEPERAEAQTKVAAFKVAAASTDRGVLATEAWARWAYVRGLAEAGIASAEAKASIGPGVASSKREQLEKFEQLLKRTADIPP